METLNVWSNTTKYVCQPATAPDYANLALAYAYGVTLINTTDETINEGEITFKGADATPENACEPGDFNDLQPVADCGPIVSGVPYTPPVKYSFADRPLAPHATCNVSIPCPQQFLQVDDLPSGVLAFVVMTRLRRWDNTDPRLLNIPHPLPISFTSPMQQPFVGTGMRAAPAAATQRAAPAAPRRGRARASASSE